MSSDPDAFYITYGTLPRSAMSYVVRPVDEMLFQALSASQYCYVLSSRQMGKSSLMIRTVTQLQSVGVTAVVIDLTSLGFNLTAEQWYKGLLEHLGRRLRLRRELEAFVAEHPSLSPMQLWLKALRDVVLERYDGPMVLFIDEIDIVRSLPFSTDEFFAAIRSCYNARTTDAAYSRLTFCLLGVATPSDLIEDVRLTPFNIGIRIHLTDFSATEATRLAAGLGQNPQTNQRLMERVLYWTGGQPCLTQRLCKAVAESRTSGATGEVDVCCEDLFLTAVGDNTDDNIANVRQHLLGNSPQETTEQLMLYDRILSSKLVPDDETMPLVARLKLSGAVKSENGRLLVRNRIYQRTFDRAWVRKNLPGAELQRQRAAFRRGVLRTSLVFATILLIVSGLAITSVLQTGRANHYADLARQETRKTQDLLYASDMSLIATAYEQNDFHLVRALLAETEKNPNRGFEWFYWEQQCHNQILTIQEHTGVVGFVAFSPDGRRIMTVCKGLVKEWDVHTGQNLLTLPHNSYVIAAEYSSDGRQILTGTYQSDSLLWDTATGRCIATYPTGDQIAFCTYIGPNIRRVERVGGPLASVSYSIEQGQLLIDRHLAKDVIWLRTSTDGRRKLSISGTGETSLWEAESNRRICVLRGHRDRMFGAWFSPDSHRILTWSRDRTAKVWDAETGRLLLTLIGHRNMIKTATFSHNGRLILTGGEDQVARLWDAASGRELMKLRGHENAIDSVCFSPDDKWVATASQDGTAKIWNIEQEQQILAGHGGGINTAVFSHTSNRILTSSDDDKVRLWDANDHRILLTLKGHKKSVNSAIFSPDDRKIVTGSDDGTVCLWDATTGMPLLKLTEPGSMIRSIAVSPDGQRIIGTAEDRNIKIWDSRTGKELNTLIGHTDTVFSVAISPDGRFIASCGVDKTVRIWDAATGALLHTLTGHTDRIYSVAFSADSRRLVTGSRDRTARIWDVKTGNPLLTLEGYDARIYSAVFSPDGHRILTGDGDTAKLWDSANGRELLSLKGHTKDVSSVAFSSDGTQIVTASADGTARIWSARPAPPGVTTH